MGQSQARGSQRVRIITTCRSARALQAWVGRAMLMASRYSLEHLFRLVAA